MLKSVEDVVEAVGGTFAAAALTGVTPPAVSNWKERRFIPSEYFALFSDKLTRLGKEADRSVFGFKAAAEAAE